MTDERRERYAVAIHEELFGCHHSETLGRTCADLADAAMAVADKEQLRLQNELYDLRLKQRMAATARHTLQQENAGLREELRTEEQTSYALRKEVERLRAELARLNQAYAYAMDVDKEQQTVINRVRAALDNNYGDNAVGAAYEALDGTNEK